VIGIANLDGTGVNVRAIGGFRGPPLGVAVEGGHVYWSLGKPSAAIGRANVDATGVDQTFIAAALDPIAIALDALPAGPPKSTRPSVPKSVSKSAALEYGLPVTATCQKAPCAIKIKALVSGATARRVHIASASGVVVGTLNTTIRSSGATTVNVRLTGKARARLRSLQQFTLSILVSVAPHGGKPTAPAKLQVVVR
jgi:hypothetical protein